MSLWQRLDFFVKVEGSERLSIQARFLLDGGGGSELEFLDTHLILPPPQVHKDVHQFEAHF